MLGICTYLECYLATESGLAHRMKVKGIGLTYSEAASITVAHNIYTRMLYSLEELARDLIGRVVHAIMDAGDDEFKAF